MLQSVALIERMLIVTRRRLIGSAVIICPQMSNPAVILAPNSHHLTTCTFAARSYWSEYGTANTHQLAPSPLHQIDGSLHQVRRVRSQQPPFPLALLRRAKGNPTKARSKVGSLSPTMDSSQGRAAGTAVEGLCHLPYLLSSVCFVTHKI
jgi:hypothetical protein